MKKVFTFLTDPFSKNLHHFLSFSVLIATFDVLYYIDQGSKNFTLCLLGHILVLAYLATAFISLLSNKYLRRAYLIIAYFVCVCYFLLGAFSYIIMHVNPRCDFLYAIMGTNTSEASEFLSTFINAKVLAIAVGVPVLLLLLSWWIRKSKKGNQAKRIIGLCFIAVCTGFFIYNPTVWSDGILGVLYPFFKYKPCPDLTQYHTHPRLNFKEPHPKNIVIIIGESETRKYCSLYGYEKPTKPRLERLRDDSLLYVFPEVTSPATYTVKTFMHLLNTSHPEDNNGKEWYETTSLFEVTQLCGYKSAWLSNQSKHGIHDNLVGHISELCDTSVFAGNKFAGMDGRNNCYDGELLPITQDMLADTSKQPLRLFIIHLMGSHEAFAMRYPAEFKTFTDSDYMHFPESQREIRAHYDNSILYDDYVVSELIKIFSEQESIVFYFSDHGLDLYESNPDYAGHSETAICLQIPFVVYTSPTFRQHFPSATERIKNSQNRKFRTDDLIYTVMDVAGIAFEDNDDVARRSLFRSSE